MSLPVPQLDGYIARRVQPTVADKPYACPGCGNEIATGVGHVVAWPERDTELRRHWHHHCWRVAAGRGRIA